MPTGGYQPLGLGIGTAALRSLRSLRLPSMMSVTPVRLGLEEMMRDSELSREMSKAARLATEACVAAGYSRQDKVTKDSAFLAAEEVYRRERPEDFAPKPAEPVPLEPVDDAWQERADLG